MATHERAVDRGTHLGRELTRSLGQEARAARRDRGLSIRAVASALRVSPATVWRVENGLSPNVSFGMLARQLAAVGLDLSARAFPGPGPIRDAGHAALLASFRYHLHGSLRWGSEVPLPQRGDQRRWDGLVSGRDWRYGVEAETGPQDAQALAGRLELKRRDGGVDGVILVVPGTRRVAGFLAGAQPILDPHFPVPGQRALELLRAGVDPGGSSLIVLRIIHQGPAATRFAR